LEAVIPSKCLWNSTWLHGVVFQKLLFTTSVRGVTVTYIPNCLQKIHKEYT
jgi:hypothetical protein